MASDPTQHPQVGLAALMRVEVDKAWTLLDPKDPQRTLPLLTRVLHAIVVKYGRMGSALAARRYEKARRDADIPGQQQIKAGRVPPLEQVDAGVRWATKDLWQAEPDLEAALTQVEGVVETLALNVGRDTTLATVLADQDAIGWFRVPEPGCCAFCALLATRGAVYRKTSFTRSNARFEGDGEFKVHPHCHCDLKPFFTAYEPTALIRQWQADYRKATRGVSGAANQRRAWRQSFEGRTPVS